MKNPNHFLVALVIAEMSGGCQPVDNAAVVRLNPEPAGHAWWLRIEFRPVHHAIRGIPVRKLDADWIRATELNKCYLPGDLLFETGRDLMAENNLEFARTGDFNKDGTVDDALVGVYEDRQGVRGGFILILTQRSGRAETIFLEKWPGKPAFVALGLNGDNLLVWGCMECDSANELGWDPKRGCFDWMRIPVETPQSEP